MNKLIDDFFKGKCYEAYKYFGAHKTNDGYVFRVFAPNALEVYLIGDFNDWKKENYQMKKIDDRGIYEIKVLELFDDYHLYRYLIKTKRNVFIEKADPYAFFSDTRPNNASKTFDVNNFKFTDQKWMSMRDKCEHKPLNIYEVHLGSFKRKEDGSFIDYESLADILIAYAKKHHFNYLEFMPLGEYPCDASWGYQTTLYYSITSRYGNPNQLKTLINKLHQNNIGVIIDFVPVHFALDSYGLANFDGGHVYESFFKNKRYSMWGSYLFDFSKVEVMSYLLSAASFLLDIYHFDGIRFDAISNMIYKDGNPNNGLQASNINWMKKTNNILASIYPTAMLIAEDSSDYPYVTKPTFENGLGFDYKWDLGWMNDTLKYLKEDPYFRGYHINLVNFSMYYFYNERFLLPLSHDEVVHMKGSIINKISGSYEQKFQQLKVLYTYMFTHPGKKLNFMGNEIANFDEWGENKPVPFEILKYPIHDAFNHYFQELGKIYENEKALYYDEYNQESFKWLSCDNPNNVFIYERVDKDDILIIILNFSSVQFEHYRFKVNQIDGYYEELLNSDKDIYNGYNFVNNYKICIDNMEIGIRIPTFSAIILKYHK